MTCRARGHSATGDWTEVEVGPLLSRDAAGRVGGGMICRWIEDDRSGFGGLVARELTWQAWLPLLLVNR